MRGSDREGRAARNAGKDRKSSYAVFCLSGTKPSPFFPPGVGLLLARSLVSLPPPLRGRTLRSPQVLGAQEKAGRPSAGIPRSVMRLILVP